MVHPDSRRGPSAELAWNFWTYNWGQAPSGHHTVISRAIDTDGAVQPAPDNPIITNKRTYWEANQHITREIVIP